MKIDSIQVLKFRILFFVITFCVKRGSKSICLTRKLHDKFSQIDYWRQNVIIKH